MIEGLIVVMVLITAFLGVRVFLKIRAMSSWKSDEEFSAGTKTAPLPQELRDLTIDESSDNLAGLSDTGDPENETKA
jgi:hypothetical protein